MTPQADSGPLREALAAADAPRATYEALRLAAGDAERGIAAAFEVIASDALTRDHAGFGVASSGVTDLWTWVARDWLPADDAVALAVTLVGETLRHRGGRRTNAPIATTWGDAAQVAVSLLDGGFDEAEARTRYLANEDGARAVVDGLLPAVRRALHGNGGPVVALGKGLELLRAFPALGPEVAGALSAMEGWRMTTTALPGWSATREAVARSHMIDRAGGTPLDVHARAAYETQVLAGEREATLATLELCARGHDVASVLRAIGHAAAVRMRRFDLAWARRSDVPAGFGDVARAVTYARAAQELWAQAPRVENVGLAVVAAGVVGRLKRADDPEPRPPDPFVGDARASRVVDAVRAREPARARAIAARIDRANRLEAFRGLAPFAAFEARVLAPHLAEAVETTEALYRMEIDDARDGAAYLDALVRYLASPVAERTFGRLATVARRRLDGDEGPPGLW